jgi:hypothetical protein
MASFNNGLATLNPGPNSTAFNNGVAATPGATAPTSPTGAGVGPANAMFGSPGATTSGAAGKTGITQGPQLSLGAKGGNSLAATGSSIAPVSSQLGGAK